MRRSVANHLNDIAKDHPAIVARWLKDHLPGAIHLGKGIIERDIEAKFPNVSTPLVLYCGGGYRSALAADTLQKMGYTDVISMDGGVREWREKGYPLTTR